MDLILRAMRESDVPDLFEMYNQPAFRDGTLALPYESFEAVK
ncbi:MAG: GNAT family N-acetyltransferase, partial [Parafilimonas terrae]|nr:GNAT family N-acetyltransferase [Parafilimonas terrae]